MRKTVLERIISRIVVDPVSGCWLWQGSRNGGGYGQLKVAGTIELVHRATYKVIRGAIPDGLTLDHECRVRRCANPYHTEPVTRGENVLRGNAPPALNARKTHCMHGHLFGGSNLYTDPRGRRACRMCKRINRRKRRE